MDHTPSKRSKLLPANAYTKLAKGESYQPIVKPSDGRAEVTLWSVAMGMGMVVLWSAACIYMALKAGNAIEAAIPVAVMAIFFGKMRKTRSTILENVMVQSIGQASGVVAAGAAFVIPALYINQLQPSWWQIFLACSIGGFLGVALIIPLRRYFVKDLHGELPFPEATAINEILCSGEKAGKAAGKVLLLSIALGAAYDFLVETVHAWNSRISSSTLLSKIGGSAAQFDPATGAQIAPATPSWGERLANARIEFNMAGLAALFGLGYIIGLRYAAIIAGGSVLAYLVLVPLIFHFGSQVPSFTYAGQTYDIAHMSSAAIFGAFVKPIGIGAIAVSGIIGMLRMGKIIAGSVSLGFKSIGKKGPATQDERTQLDLDPRKVLIVTGLSSLAMGALFFVVSMSSGGYGAGQSLLFAGAGMLVGFILSFLFTPVAAQAIATVGTNPVSGMTLITLVIAAGVMTTIGLKGPAGMFVALVIGTAVCTVLSTSGALVSDFKIGYWIGSTPKNQQVWKFAGIALAALTVAFIIPVMDSSYHFLIDGPNGTKVSNTDVLPAPQANMLAAIVNGLMSNAEQPILLYALGGIVAVMLYMAGVPMLAFALGMYLPISINLTVLAGGFVAWIVSKTGKTKEIQTARSEQGTLIASGLMAGAAIIGILSALTRLPELKAVIRFLSIGDKFAFETKESGAVVLTSALEYCERSVKPVLEGFAPNVCEQVQWYKGFVGQGLSLVAFIGLAFLAYLLARQGAKWEMAEAAEAEREDTKSAPPPDEQKQAANG